MKMQHLRTAKTRLTICLIWVAYLCQQVSAELKDVPYTTVWEVDDKGNYKERWWTDQMYNIPQILWQTYGAEIYPIEAIWRSLSWIRLNPQYSYRHISDFDYQNTVLAYVHPNYHDMLLNHLPTNNGRMSDFFRFLTLYLYGGVYSDIDNYPYKELSEWDHYPFNDIGIMFSGEGFFMEQYFMFVQPRHPLLGQFLTIFMDTFKHDSQMLHDGRSIDYGGPGMWLLALYDICDMNPFDTETYVDEMFHNGRGWSGWKLHEHPYWVYNNYKNRDSKLRKCCDYYSISIIDDDHWMKWPFVHNKRPDGWKDGYTSYSHGIQGKLRIPALKDILVYARIFSDEYRYRKDNESQLTNQYEQLECQAKLIQSAYEKAFKQDPDVKTAADKSQCDKFVYGVISFNSNEDPKNRRFLQSKIEKTIISVEEQVQTESDIEILDILTTTAPWIHFVALLFWIRAFQLRQKIKSLNQVPFTTIQSQGYF